MAKSVLCFNGNLRSGFIALVVLALPISTQFILPDYDPPVKQSDTEVGTKVPQTMRAITALVRDPAKRIALITWQNPGLKQAVVVLRASVPVSSYEILRNAVRIAVLPVGASSFEDTAPSDGPWFYAVIGADELDDRDVTLFAGENYTGIALNFAGQAAAAGLPPQVSLIYAELLEDGIRISWRANSVKELETVVYRGVEPLDTPERIENATRLTVIRDNATVFLDNRLPGPGTYYYAVTTRDGQGKEDRRLVADQSYTRNGITYSFTSLPVVAELSAVARRDNSVQLKWRESDEFRRKSLRLDIYRSVKPIRSWQDIAAAEKTGVVDAGAGVFNDDTLEPGRYFYAVVTREHSGRTSAEFMPGGNILLVPVEIGTVPTKEPPVVITEKPPEGKQAAADLFLTAADEGVVAEWRITSELADVRRLLLFRFPFRPRGTSELDKGTLIAKLPPTAARYTDLPPDGDRFYYVLVLETKEGLSPQTFSRNVAGPVRFEDEPYLEKPEKSVPVRKKPPVTAQKPDNQKSKPVKPAEENTEDHSSESSGVLQIVQETYVKGEYQEAVHRLAPYTRPGSFDAHAGFYSGLSYFRLGRYDKALDYFVHPAVVQTYGDRSRFWYRRTLERWNGRIAGK